MTIHDYIQIASAILVGTFGSARVTRLFVADSWPPSVKLRIWWKGKANELWEPLLTCPWCFAPYVVALNMLAAWASELHPVWWMVNLWLALSYLASWIVFHDED